MLQNSNAPLKNGTVSVEYFEQSFGFINSDTHCKPCMSWHEGHVGGASSPLETGIGCTNKAVQNGIKTGIEFKRFRFERNRKVSWTPPVSKKIVTTPLVKGFDMCTHIGDCDM